MLDRILLFVANLLPNMIKSETKTATTGTTLYNDLYFADISLTIPQGYEFLSAEVISATNNRFAYAEFLGWTMRAWSKISNTSVTIKVNYRKTF